MYLGEQPATKCRSLVKGCLFCLPATAVLETKFSWELGMFGSAANKPGRSLYKQEIMAHETGCGVYFRGKSVERLFPISVVICLLAIMHK